MLWKLVLLASATLFVVKLVFRTRLRHWGQKLDRAVNVTLLAIGITYSLYFVWLVFGASPAPH